MAADRDSEIRVVAEIVFESDWRDGKGIVGEILRERAGRVIDALDRLRSSSGEGEEQKRQNFIGAWEQDPGSAPAAEGEGRDLAELIARRIRELREGRGWTQKDVADRLGVTQTAISYWEAEKRSPSLQDLPALAEAFDVAVADLLAASPSSTGAGSEDYIRGFGDGHREGEESAQSKAFAESVDRHLAEGFTGAGERELPATPSIEASAQAVAEFRARWEVGSVEDAVLSAVGVAYQVDGSAGAGAPSAAQVAEEAIREHQRALDDRSLGKPEQVKRDRDDIDNALYNATIGPSGVLRAAADAREGKL